MLSRLFKRERKSAPVDLWALIDGGAATAAGVSVSAESALRVPIVWACVKVLSESVSALPAHVYRRLLDGGKERRADHPLAAILGSQVSEWQTAYDWRAAMMVDLLTRGNAFSAIVRAGGRVRELHQLPASSVSVEADRATGEPRYFVTDATGTRREWDRRDILHIRGLPDPARPFVGMSPLERCREAVAVAVLLERHAAHLFDRGAKPAGLLETDRQLTPDVLTRLKTTFESSFGGSENAGRTAVLEAGLKFKPLTLNSTDAQYLELRRFAVEEIGRTFRVPPHMVGDLTRATFSNIESQQIQFATDTLLPWVRNWEQALNMSLLDEDERADHFCELSIDGIMRGDLKSRYEAFASALAAGYLTANEVRAMENRVALPGGDVLRSPLNTAPATQPQPDPSAA